MNIYLKPGQSIQEALDHYDADTTIDLYLSSGIYDEKLRIKHHHLTIHGSGADSTVITHGDYAYKMHEDGLLYNTFRTYTMMILGNHVSLHDLSIQNTCGSGFTIGQGVALSLMGTNTKLMNCHISGHQDTLFIGPLPEDLCDRYDHFLPLAERKRSITHHHFFQTTIEGDVDFIFGSGIVLFESCHIIAKAKGYIAAPSTYPSFPYGFVFWKSQIINQSLDEVYLARPWREGGSVTFIDCQFQGSFSKQRYHAWEKETMRFRETPYIPSLLSTELKKEEKEQLLTEIQAVLHCS